MSPSISQSMSSPPPMSEATKARSAERPNIYDFLIEVNDEQDFDDDFIFNDGLHEMTPEEWDRYGKQVSESGGFDIDPLPGVFALGIIVPYPMDPNYPDLLRYIKLAIDHHNNKYGTKLKMKEAVKWNLQVMSPFVYYITFTAEDENTHEVDTYQTKVVGRIPEEDTYVDMVRVKPKKRPGSAAEVSPTEETSSKKFCC